MDPKGKVALVTGGARRVGKTLALGLAARGMDVLIHYNRSEDEARETVQHIRRLGVQGEAVQGNLGNPLDIEAVFVALESYFGRIDVLVNSASAFQPRSALELTVDEWNYVMAINLRAPFLCSQRAAHLMLAWQRTGPLDRRYVVFVHLLKDGSPAAANGLPDSATQSGHEPGDGRFPTIYWETWTRPAIVLDEQRLEIPPETPVGVYYAWAGAYDKATGDRIELGGPGQTLRLVGPLRVIR